MKDTRKNGDQSKKGIKSFFAPKSGKGDAAGNSPESTSDYESEPSRCATPMTSENGSHSNSPERNDVEIKGEKSKRQTPKVLRKIKEEEDEDEEETVDIFNTSKDEDKIKEEDDLLNAKAAVKSGLISAEALNEEQRIKLEADRMEKDEKVKRQQLAQKEETQKISQSQRFERLKGLLGKSKFYSDFLLQKMQSTESAMMLKEDKKAARAKKREEEDKKNTPSKAKDTPEPKKKGRPGRKSSVDQESNELKRKAEEDERNAKRAKLDEDKKDMERTWNGKKIPDGQPLLLTGGILRQYQMDGYEWMSTLWENGINGILADEMGLGKTIQVISLFCHMYEMGVSGPFLVVAPLSTVPNWFNEFKRFAPKVPCLLYHGNPTERMEMRSKLTEKKRCDELDVDMLHVVVTSYEIAMNDRAAFSNIMWRYIVVDEGHRLKNMNCRLIKELKLYHSANRLLLTGTPLQNNLSELWSLLNFLLPEIFDDLRVFESWFDAKEMDVNVEEEKRIVAQEQQNSILSTLHQILTPFLLRRIKADVDLDIPPKKEVLVYCPMTETQREMYTAIVNKMIQNYMAPNEEEEVLKEDKHGRSIRGGKKVDYSMFLSEKEFANDDKFEEYIAQMTEYRDSISSKSSNMSNAYQNNIDKMGMTGEQNFSVKSRMMDMRKSVNHPYLIDYPLTEDGGFYRSDEEMVTICGKLRVLDQLLEQLNARGHKTLIFSQMTKMLDIIGDYLTLRKLKFSRLDGTMGYLERQENIDAFNTNPDIKIFLLSTRAGGLGINLTSADTCIIYDSDWNPQQDLQAQDRCHRIGQTKPVMVYRLVTANTIDQKIVERAAAKRKLEKMIMHKEKFKTGAKSITTSLKSISPQELLQLLASKDHVGALECSEGEIFNKAQMDQLLDRSSLAWSDEKKKAAGAVDGVKGVFQVIDEDDGGRPGMGSISEKPIPK